MPNDVRQILLETLEISLQAQLTAIRRLRKAGGKTGEGAGRPRKQRRSQVSIVFDILTTSAHPLHISEIIQSAQQRFHLKLDRESLVSALTKRLARDDRFERTAPNTFGLRSPKTSGKEP